MRDLTVTLVQCQLAWENPADNRAQIEAMIRAHNQKTDIIMLPEMFTTGFSMNAIGNAEPEAGDTLAWMQQLARDLDCAITGSIAVRAGDNVFNRMLFVTPEWHAHYDKRHLFRMAGEHNRYGVGSDRVIVEWRDWRIKLEVCYDLRFPVFSRNRNDYDALLYVANWPAPRAPHWRALLLARAIENLACVAGVNRIGSDANGHDYSGDSAAITAMGEYLADMLAGEGCSTVTFNGDDLIAYRQAFPAHLDADDFELTLD